MTVRISRDLKITTPHLCRMRAMLDIAYGSVHSFTTEGILLQRVPCIYSPRRPNIKLHHLYIIKSTTQDRFLCKGTNNYRMGKNLPI